MLLSTWGAVCPYISPPIGRSVACRKTQSMRCVSMWGVELDVVAGMEWLSRLITSWRILPAHPNTVRKSETNRLCSKSLKEKKKKKQVKNYWSWLIFHLSKTTTQIFFFFQGELIFPLARLILEPFEQTGFKLNEAADILLFLRSRPLFPPPQPTLHFFLSGWRQWSSRGFERSSSRPDASPPLPALRQKGRRAFSSSFGARRLRLITGSLVASFRFSLSRALVRSRRSGDGSFWLTAPEELASLAPGAHGAPLSSVDTYLGGVGTGTLGWSCITSTRRRLVFPTTATCFHFVFCILFYFKTGWLAAVSSSRC